jgi:hypothetical protein
MSSINSANLNFQPQRGIAARGEPARRATEVARTEQGAIARRRVDQAEEPALDSAAEVLNELGDEAMEFPPKNITVLAASVQKFFLTNLEPALRIAREIREQAADAPLMPWPTCPLATVASTSWPSSHPLAMVKAPFAKLREWGPQRRRAGD